jgi:hypothetical protein
VTPGRRNPHTRLHRPSHTHTHTRAYPPPSLPACTALPPAIRPSSYIHSAMEAQPFLDDQKGSRHTQIVRGDGSTRSGGTSVLMVRRSQPADPARARLFRASIRFPTRSRLLSLCAHFPCATMSVRAGCGAQEWSFDTKTL